LFIHPVLKKRNPILFKDIYIAPKYDRSPVVMKLLDGSNI